MKANYINVDSSGSITPIISLDWLDKSTLNHSNGDKGVDVIISNSDSLNKLIYEQWCKTKVEKKKSE